MFKRILSILLVFSMMFSLGIPVFAEDTTTLIELGVVDFKKSGIVTTLVNNYDKEYYFINEELSADNSYYGKKIKTVITKEKFLSYLSGKAYDRLIVNTIGKNGSEPVYASFVFDAEDHLISSSYYGGIVDGSFREITVDTTSESYSWI